MRYRFERLDLTQLSQAEKEQFYFLAPPKFRCCLDGRDPDDISFTILVAIGAFEGNKPIGLALGGVYDVTGMGEVFSLEVEHARRHAGVGTTLLQAMEKACREEKANFVIGYYRKSGSSFPYLEKIFQRLKWEKSSLFMVRYFFDIYNFYPPWFEHPPTFPPEYEIFPWDELKPNEREDIESRYEQGHFDASVYPFQMGESWEPINSLGLRYKKQVIGWMVTHRASPDTLRYSALYIQPEFQSKGHAVRLLVNSIKKQQASPVRWCYFELNVLEADPTWIKFVTQRLAPYALDEDRIYQIWKRL